MLNTQPFCKVTKIPRMFHLAVGGGAAVARRVGGALEEVVGGLGLEVLLAAPPPRRCFHAPLVQQQTGARPS